MGEPTEVVVDSRSEVAGKMLMSKIDGLFGVHARYGDGFEVNTNTKNLNDLKTKVEGVVAALLDAAKAFNKGEEVSSQGLKIRDYFEPGKTRLDQEELENRFSMALGVVRGERADSERLVDVMGVLSDTVRRDATTQRKIEEAKVREVGFLGMGGKDSSEMKKINDKYSLLDGNALSILAKVQEKAGSEWARKS
jgi:hypothetical protein